MEKKSPIVRLLLALWLLSSQVAGAAMVFAPVVVLFAFSSRGGATGALNFLLALGYLLPILFIGLGVAAWVMFARKKDAASGWLGLATLAPGGLMLLAMGLVNP
ncbi:MAG: hypothetical protein JNK32_07420 [Anaerolineales bacterium]|nr:hypothetical protein [Anaerolineales bacterium]